MTREGLLYQRGMEIVREHPGRAAWLYVVKLGNLFALYPRAVPAVDGGTGLGDDAAAPKRQSVKRYRTSVKKASKASRQPIFLPWARVRK
jgi:hypothetical protein